MAHEICNFITICLAIVSGIITGDAAISYSPIFSLVLRDSPTSLCES